jgi:hypothetical protein
LTASLEGCQVNPSAPDLIRSHGTAIVVQTHPALKAIGEPTLNRLFRPTGGDRFYGKSGFISRVHLAKMGESEPKYND